MPNPPIPQSIYDPEVISAILERVVAGESLVAILGNDRPEGWPCFKTWFNWLAKGNAPNAPQHLADLVQQYAGACEARTAAQAEKMLYESEQKDVSEVRTVRRKQTEKGYEEVEEVRLYDNTERTKIKIDAMKWTMAKMLPKKYGNPKDDGNGEDNSLIIHGGLPDA